MKELKFVLASLALLSLGMTSCMTTPKLDLSTVDTAQPIPVIGILMRTPSGDRQDQFYQKYGYGDWNNDPAKQEQLLDMLCGTASRNWASIAAKVKNETGLTLNGDEFLNDLQNGRTDRIVTQKSKTPFDDRGYFFQWTAIEDVEYAANIGLICREGGVIEIFDVVLHKLDVTGWTESKTTIASF
jgi:hypothetical protein